MSNIATLDLNDTSAPPSHVDVPHKYEDVCKAVTSLIDNRTIKQIAQLRDLREQIDELIKAVTHRRDLLLKAVDDDTKEAIDVDNTIRIIASSIEAVSATINMRLPTLVDSVDVTRRINDDR